MVRQSDHREPYTAITSLLVLGAGLAGLFLGIPNWWLVFVIGYAVVVPIVAILTDADDEPDDVDEADGQMNGTLRGHVEERDVPDSKHDALDTLRERYAQGELSEEQFEAKLERLLETETLEDARASVERSNARAESERETE